MGPVDLIPWARWANRHAQGEGPNAQGKGPGARSRGKGPDAGGKEPGEGAGRRGRVRWAGAVHLRTGRMSGPGAVRLRTGRLDAWASPRAAPAPGPRAAPAHSTRHGRDDAIAPYPPSACISTLGRPAVAAERSSEYRSVRRVHTTPTRSRSSSSVAPARIGDLRSVPDTANRHV